MRPWQGIKDMRRQDLPLDSQPDAGAHHTGRALLPKDNCRPLGLREHPERPSLRAKLGMHARRQEVQAEAQKHSVKEEKKYINI